MRQLLPCAWDAQAADRRRRWTPLLLAVAALLMAWETAPTLDERFARARCCLRQWFGRRCKLGGTYQGIAKAMGRDKLHQTLAVHLRRRMRCGCGVHWRRLGFCCFAADGTRIDCPRTSANKKALGRGGRQRSGPQLCLTSLWHMGSGLPWSWRIGRADSCERYHLRDMLAELPTGSLLVCDAGFAGYNLLRQMRRRQLHLLVRVGSNIHLLRRLGCRREGKQTVYLWPGGGRGRSRRRSPLPLRLIKLVKPRHKRHGRKTPRAAYVVTDLPASRLSQHAAQTLYAMRWGVEVFYRGLKQKLQRRKMLSASPRRARVELHWAMLGLWLIGLLAVRAAIAAGHDPLGWSVALALRAVRDAVRGEHGLAPALAAAAAGADHYRRTGSKTARRWPHKKRDHPPGPPHVRDATSSEISRAREVYDERVAA
jgi:hypothetical protein